jgi:psp operon transcriptional activator
MPDAPDILGQSEPILEAKARISRAAKVNRPVLIVGERGTGKELAAARLHYLSPRWQGPYVTMNCAALSQSLLDAELFGYEAGAFTGAEKRRAGRFKAADGGTLFLDEISHLTMEAQAKILRVVEYGRFQLVGSPAEQSIDARVVAATNADLPKMCRAGKFLPDLLDRLSFEIIELPPLRRRPGDASYLAHVFAARMARELKMADTPLFTPEALELLERESWPGNVRELKNAVERAVYGADGPSIGPRSLGLEKKSWPGVEGESDRDYAESPKTDSNQSRPAFPLSPGQFDLIIGQTGANLIEAALGAAGHNQRKAAKLLGLSYDRFRFLRKKFF